MLAIKVSPDAYTFDGNAWLPVTQRVDAANQRNVKEAPPPHTNGETRHLNGHSGHGEKLTNGGAK